MARTTAQITGTMRVGQGKQNKLHHITVNTVYGDTNKIDVLVSAEGRYVWMQMDGDNARKLAQTILPIANPLKDDNE